MKSIQQLKIATILYLLIPSLLFLCTWVHLWIGIPCIVFIVFYVKNTFETAEDKTDNGIAIQHFLLSIGISLLLNFMLGIGEFRYQTYDFQANNFKFYDLVTHQLPVYYPKQQTFLCYYTGYYLPSAMLAKVFGLASCRYISYLWSVLGLALVFLWISTFSRKNFMAVIVGILLFSHSWVVIKVLMNIEFFKEVCQPYYFQLNQFKLITQSFVKNYSWAIQHTLPACLGACVLIHIYQRDDFKQELKYLLLMLLSTMFWSPLTTIGLFPFVAFCFLKNLKMLLKYSEIKNLLWMIGIVVAFSPLMLYFISTEGVHANNTEFMWETGVSFWFLIYLIYIFSNFIIWGVLLHFYQNPNKVLWRMAVTFPCLVAFYRIGIYNDFNIRVSFPAFFILSILVSISLVEKFRWKSVWSFAIGAFILINSFPNLNQLQKGILYLAPITTIEKPFVLNATNMLEFQRVAYGDESAVLEYSLKKGSIFEQYFLKK